MHFYTMAYLVFPQVRFSNKIAISNYFASSIWLLAQHSFNQISFEDFNGIFIINIIREYFSHYLKNKHS